MLKKQKEANKLDGAICASSALVFEPHGLLKGKKATAFPALRNKLSDPSEAENRVVVDGNLITSRWPGTSREFALAITEKLFGCKKALELAKAVVFVHNQNLLHFSSMSLKLLGTRRAKWIRTKSMF